MNCQRKTTCWALGCELLDIQINTYIYIYICNWDPDLTTCSQHAAQDRNLIHRLPCNVHFYIRMSPPRLTTDFLCGGQDPVDRCACCNAHRRTIAVGKECFSEPAATGSPSLTARYFFKRTESFWRRYSSRLLNVRTVAARQRLPGMFSFHKALVAQLRVISGLLLFILHPQTEQVLRQNLLAIVFDTGPLSPLQGRHWRMTALRAFPFVCSNLVPLLV